MRKQTILQTVGAATLIAACVLTSAGPVTAQTSVDEELPRFVYDQTVGRVVDIFMTGNWRQIEGASQLSTQSVVKAQAVRFQSGTASLLGDERDRLMTFLLKEGISREDTILLDGLRGLDRQHLEITAQRMEALRLELSDLGFRSRVADQPVTVHSEGDDRVAVIVVRTLVSLPDCSARAPDRGNRPVHVRNCANVTNLGLMVANPADLRQGAVASPADGTASVLGIERYRRGEIIPLDDTLSTQGIDE